MRGVEFFSSSSGCFLESSGNVKKICSMWILTTVCRFLFIIIPVKLVFVKEMKVILNLTVLSC